MSEIALLKKERRSLRCSISLGKNKIIEILGREELNEDNCAELRSKLNLLTNRYEELTFKDSEIKFILMRDEEIDETQLAEEQEGVDEYTTLFYKIKYLAETRIDAYMTDKNDVRSVVSLQSQTASRYKLPILKLKEFDGNLGGWLPFWSQFEKIDKDETLANIDKMGYLAMSMTPDSPAARFVQSYPATSEMYPEVVKALKARFGRDDLLTEFYIRELLKIILQNSKHKLSIESLYDALQCHLRNLEVLNVSTENCASILMPLVSSCLPEEILQIWERNCMSQITISNPEASSKDFLKSLMAFLKAEVESLQKLAQAKDGFGLSSTISPKAIRPMKQDKRKQDDNFPTAADLVNIPSISCIFCSNSHSSQDCRKGMKMSIVERRAVVKKKQVCYCLKSGHRASRCRNRPICTICGKSHFAILCDEAKKDDLQSVAATVSIIKDQMLTFTNHCKVLMQTLLVNIQGKNGKRRKARLLIDTGSQRSYILSSTAQEMGYVPIREEIIQHALFGGNVTSATNHKVFQLNISSLDTMSNNNYKFEVLDHQKICGPIATVPKGPWMYELVAKDIHLSDVGLETEIEILVGSDVAGKLWTGERLPLSSDLVAMKTCLGWTLSGNIPVTKPQSSNIATVVTDLIVKDATVADLWSLDTLGITDPAEKACKADIDKATLEHFLSTVNVNSEGRYEINLPFIKNHPSLSNNYLLSVKRLQSTIKKLKHDGYLNEYQKVFKDWQEKKIIEEVPPDEINKFAHYLPHHHVIKIGSTTPVRPVFDASAKELGKCSLNECLEKGPNLIEKIPSCLARFRLNKIGITSDIEKAFLQISVCKQDRDFLRFLWQNEEGQLMVFRHCRVVFGVSPSPFLLEASIRLHLEEVIRKCKEEQSKWPIPLVELLKESFYVDNCLTSLEDEKEAQKFIDVASSIMMERRFNLRGWEWSGQASTNATNVLGLQWDKEKDTLSINIASLLSMNTNVITKKVLLSAAHRIFDPIGIISSFALIPKLLLQQIWQSRLTWNEEVDENTKTKFIQWMTEIPSITDIQIPRWVVGGNVSKEKWSLHVFSDASKVAYAAAVFLRVEHENKTTVQLLMSKTRVAPTSKTKSGMTIPRLELLAASIATRLYQTVIKDFLLYNVKTIFWTDASTVLAWIRRNEPWNVFVMNRVKEIRSLSIGCEWRHVPGNMNPADSPSRGCSVKKLIQCRWWEGPKWLKGDSESWPQQNELLNEDEVIAERKKLIVSSMLYQSATFEGWYKYFSQYKKTD